MTNLYVNFVKFSNIDSKGNETEVNFALHIFNDWNELLIEHTTSFEVLKTKITLDYLFEILTDSCNNEFLQSFENAGGLYFNKEWITFEQMKKAYLINKYASGFVPGHGPDLKTLSNMSIEELEKRVNLITLAFELAFSEEDEEENEFEEEL